MSSDVLDKELCQMYVQLEATEIRLKDMLKGIIDWNEKFILLARSSRFLSKVVDTPESTVRTISSSMTEKYDVACLVAETQTKLDAVRSILSKRNRITNLKLKLEKAERAYRKSCLKNHRSDRQALKLLHRREKAASAYTVERNQTLKSMKAIAVSKTIYPEEASGIKSFMNAQLQIYLQCRRKLNACLDDESMHSHKAGQSTSCLDGIFRRKRTEKKGTDSNPDSIPDFVQAKTERKRRSSALPLGLPNMRIEEFLFKNKKKVPASREERSGSETSEESSKLNFDSEDESYYDEDDSIDASCVLRLGRSQGTSYYAF